MIDPAAECECLASSLVMPEKADVLLFAPENPCTKS